MPATMESCSTTKVSGTKRVVQGVAEVLQRQQLGGGRRSPFNVIELKMALYCPQGSGTLRQKVLKIAIYCPQGSGTLRQQLLRMH